MRDVQFAGEYNLENCEIISSAGVAVDISPNIVEINIFENIFKLFKIIFLVINIKTFFKKSKNKTVIIEGASWIGYSYLTIKILKILDPNIFIIYHSHNIEYLLRLKKNNFIISFLSKFFEKKVYQISDIGTAVSKFDQNTI